MAGSKNISTCVEDGGGQQDFEPVATTGGSQTSLDYGLLQLSNKVFKFEVLRYMVMTDNSSISQSNEMQVADETTTRKTNWWSKRHPKRPRFMEPDNRKDLDSRNRTFTPIVVACTNNSEFSRSVTVDER